MANTEKKVTRKDYFNALRALIEGTENVGKYATDDVVAFIDNEIAKIDAKAAKAKEKAAEKKAEGDELADRIFAVITNEFQTGDAITAALDDAEITKGKVVARLAKFVKDGSVVKEKIKVENGEKIAYKLA